MFALLRSVRARSYGRRLIAAVSNGDTEIVRTLLAKGADPNTVDSDGTPVLTKGCRYGGIAQALLEAGGDPNCKTRSGGYAPLSAIDREDLDVARALLGAGAHLEVATSDGYSPLRWAAMRGLAKSVAVLIAGTGRT